MRAVRGIAVLHPFPSLLNAVLVGTLAMIAGASLPTPLVLGTAMLGFQVSIGALNDIVDAPTDRHYQPHKPLSAGSVSPGMAWIAVVAGGALGVTISAAFGVSVLIIGIVGYGSGLAYDLFMRRFGLGWLCFAVAFPMLLAWVWVAVTGALPPGSVALLPVAALAGPAIHLANGLVDPSGDEQSAVASLATRLGAGRGVRVLALLQALVFGLGWITLTVIAELQAAVVAIAVLATVLVVLGVTMSATSSRKSRDIGWMAQAVAVATLGVAWLTAVTLA